MPELNPHSFSASERCQPGRLSGSVRPTELRHQTGKVVLCNRSRMLQDLTKALALFGIVKDVRCEDHQVRAVVLFHKDLCSPQRLNGTTLEFVVLWRHGRHRADNDIVCLSLNRRGKVSVIKSGS